MHSNSIPANLLDIIFKNRNKDYGAYVLRKDYNKRLSASLAIMLALVAVFAGWELLADNKPAAGLPNVIFIPDPSISPVKPPEYINRKTDHLHAGSFKTANDRPVIVKDFPVDKKQSENIPIISSGPDGDIEGPPFETAGSGENNSAITEAKETVTPAVAVIDKSIPVNSAEVLPQFPGGLDALVRFLKRNLNAPRELEEGEVVSVKVKFIVSFTGDLAGFNVVESGGNTFDNEVIRVLKKMPKWIPGKTRGENVSVWFTVPVKFAVSD